MVEVVAAVVAEVVATVIGAAEVVMVATEMVMSVVMRGGNEN